MALWTPAMNRKGALKKLNGLMPRVEVHLEKLRTAPESQDVPHWCAELESWLRQMEELLPVLGRKTSREWGGRIERWRQELES